jgi:hypothetical protein
VTRRGAGRGAAVVGVGLAVALAACGSDSPRPSASSSGSSSSYPAGSGYDDPAGSARSVHVEAPDVPGLPPRAFQGLSALYADAFAAEGMRLTRGAVIQLPTGPHLQLYAEPTGTTTNADYVARIATLARAVAPGAFADYPSLASLDVCQEPPPGVDDSKEPPPETVLFITRAQAATVAWDTVTVTDLRRVIAASSGGELQVSATIAADPAWTSTAP